MCFGEAIALLKTIADNNDVVVSQQVVCQTLEFDLLYRSKQFAILLSEWWCN